ncbi:MAG: Pvc16 family protein [Isosphaeraceae bacterium]
MIHQLSQAIEMLIKRGIEGVEVSFDRPAEDFSSRLSVPTVNAFLYDVREEVALRSSEWSFERSNGAVRVLGVPFHATCSYVLTAWPVHTPGASDPRPSVREHELLGKLMQFLASRTEIPADIVDGLQDLPADVFGDSAGGPPAAGTGQLSPPVPLTLSTVDDKGSLSEFWTALGCKLRPSFVLRATIALDRPVVRESAQAASSLRLDLDPVDQGPLGSQPRYLIGGRVTTREGRPLHVRVSIDALNRQVESDAQGNYALRDIAAGTHVVRVASIRDGSELHSRTLKVPRTSKSDSSYDLILEPGS